MTDEQPPQAPDEPTSVSWKPGESETEPTPTTGSNRPPTARRRAPIALVIVLAILLVGALGAAGYLYTQYTDRDDRVGELEDELDEVRAEPSGQGQEAFILNALLDRFSEVATAQEVCIDALRERPAAADDACAEADELYASLRADLEGAASAPEE